MSMLGSICLTPGAPDIRFVVVITDRHHAHPLHHVEAVRDLPQH